jgi:hypothetical protein
MKMMKMIKRRIIIWSDVHFPESLPVMTKNNYIW